MSNDQTEDGEMAAMIAAITPLTAALSATLKANTKTLEALICMPEAINTGDDSELRPAVNDALDQLAGATIMIEDSMTAIEMAANRIKCRMDSKGVDDNHASD